MPMIRQTPATRYARLIVVWATRAVRSSRSVGLRLNISSIRSVTRKPPTTLIVPNTTATNASACSRVESAEPAISMAPTRMMPVDGVRARHERRVQERRHARDQLEAEEDREHEDGDAGQERLAHALSSRVARPPWATHVLRTISSSKSSTSSPSLMRSPRNAWTLREYIWLACTGMVAGTFVRPTMVTPSVTIVSPGCGRGAVAAGLGGEVDDHGARAHAAHGVLGDQLGAGRPGISAVVMTASDSAAWRAMSSCSRACWSSASATA